ncbi:hypothetical protein Patl1_34573 [Pistacia atlantica]|uniref:Uncharacterized protein n=1 Tax=Pistacia atlantica TaxID=434234 RepID=A0ACC0ZQK6_9ROSI|nr:hypothetical protein Patl1_34573 [Pistacia atlantica]
MGNVCSASVSCDPIVSRILDCTTGKVAYISDLKDNLDALQTELQKLIEARNDVMRRVNIAEQQQMKRPDQVQGWLSRVQDVEAGAGEVLEIRSQEIEKLCCGGYCSKNCNSSYKFGKKVAKKLKLVCSLKGEGAFEVVAERSLESVLEERPSEPIMGLQLIFDEAWRCIEEEQVGTVGLYGMGAVGKTTFLIQINNKLLDFSNSYDTVIWVVVSRDLQLEKIQERIGQKIGLVGESWKNKSIDEKASDIFKILRKKKFIVLLDDIWERVDLIKVGIPLRSVEVGCKIVFTTRFLDVCGLMEADRNFKVECLGEEEAWKLFEKKVGREILDSHPDILELAKLVAKECGGLPLALITIGRAMSCKKTPEECRYAIQVLRRASSKFPVYSHGYYIIGVLVHACLLEEEEEERGDYFVKMHDVIRDMTLWIACDIKEEQQKFLVQVGVGLTKAPKIKEWEELKRISLMENKIEELSVTPTCPDLLTLFLNEVVENSVLFGGGEDLVKELLGLESLCVLSITLKSCHALHTFLNSHKFQNYTHGLTLRRLDDSKMLNVLSLADLKHLRRLEIENCENLEELKMEHVKLKKLPLDANSAKGQKIVISGNENWWKGLEWESEATRTFMFVVSYSWMHMTGVRELFHGVPDILFKNMSLPAPSCNCFRPLFVPNSGRLMTRNCWKKLSGQTLSPPKQGCGKIGQYFTSLDSLKFMND